MTDSELLARLGAPKDDARLVLADRPRSNDERDLVDAWAHELVAGIGEDAPTVDWPDRDDFLHVWAFVEALPAIRAYHRDRGVADEVSWSTLADLGRALGEHRRRRGRPGFDHAWWLSRHWRGRLFRLGRLQFERSGPALDVHIPRDGPLVSAACDASFAAARAFFPRHIPEQPAHVGRCTSWLLDPQLAAYLPPKANIIRFQRRFELDDEVLVDDDDNIRMFVFGAAAGDPPQRTTLERAIVAHLAAGRHWHVRRGSTMIG